jgi:hypothetical protein
MKSKDLATLAVVVLISIFVSVGLSKVLFSSGQKKLTVEVVDPISAEFTTPDKRYFNNESVDPTKVITIGDGANPDPFSANQQ